MKAISVKQEPDNYSNSVLLSQLPPQDLQKRAWVVQSVELQGTPKGQERERNYSTNYSNDLLTNFYEYLIR